MCMYFVPEVRVAKCGGLTRSGIPGSFEAGPVNHRSVITPEPLTYPLSSKKLRVRKRRLIFYRISGRRYGKARKLLVWACLVQIHVYIYVGDAADR